MDLKSYQKIESWYVSYVHGFKTSGNFSRMQRIKETHNERVAHESERLALELGWPEQEILTAKLLGLLHDVGRFSQLQEFKTFDDRVSVDHAGRGYDVLQSEKVLAEVSEEDRMCLLEGVRYHNKKDLPGNLEAKSLRFLKLIRDTDKLDIFKVLYESMISGEVKKHPEILFSAPLDGKVSAKLVGEMRQEKLVSYTEIKCMADLFLVQMSWVFNLYYKPTLRFVKERNVLEKIRDYFSEDAGMQEAFLIAESFRDRAIRGEVPLASS